MYYSAFIYISVVTGQVAFGGGCHAEPVFPLSECPTSRLLFCVGRWTPGPPRFLADHAWPRSMASPPRPRPPPTPCRPPLAIPADPSRSQRRPTAGRRLPSHPRRLPQPLLTLAQPLAPMGLMGRRALPRAWRCADVCCPEIL